MTDKQQTDKERIAAAMASFEARGGEIKKCPPGPVPDKVATVRLASNPKRRANRRLGAAAQREHALLRRKEAEISAEMKKTSSKRKLQ